MSDSTSTTTPDFSTLTDAELAAGIDPTERPKFKPDYEVGTRRIWRTRLRPNEGGKATVTFRGTVHNALDDVWIADGHLFAEVEPTEDTATRLEVAVVPTGKRVPEGPNGAGTHAHRIGSAGRSHFYLLDVDSSVDRAAYDAEQEARRVERKRRAQQARAMIIPMPTRTCADPVDHDFCDC